MEGKERIEEAKAVADFTASVQEVELISPVNFHGNVYDKVVIREMTGVEEDLLASKKISSSLKFDKLLTSVIDIVIGENNRIEDKDVIFDFVRELMQLDRMNLLLQLRILSLGSEYQFEYTCSGCKKTNYAMVLLDDIQIKKPNLEGVSENGLYDIDVYGHKFTMKILTAKDEVSGLVENDVLTTMLAQRIVKIDDKKGDLNTVKRLPIKFRQKLRNVIKLREGDIDLTIEAQCKYCGNVDRIEIDLGDTNFFFPAEGES